MKIPKMVLTEVEADVVRVLLTKRRFRSHEGFDMGLVLYNEKKDVDGQEFVANYDGSLPGCLPHQGLDVALDIELASGGVLNWPVGPTEGPPFLRGIYRAFGLGDEWVNARDADCLCIHAKTADECVLQLLHGGVVLAGHDGYVPEWFPDDHYGDYVILCINLLTGVIVNWSKKRVTGEALSKTFFEHDDDD